MRHLLFLCTGNYYRSRFSEHLFNALALREGLAWKADSRGVATDLGTFNVGPISPFTLEALKVRGVAVTDSKRGPQQLLEADLAAADLVIALDEEEHRPFMRERFPKWEDRIQYWKVADLHAATTEQAFPLMEEQVRALVKRLKG